MTAQPSLFDAPARERAETHRARLFELLSHPFGQKFTLQVMAARVGAPEPGVSARWREICRKWEGRKRQVEPGLWVYWLTGNPRPLEPARKSPRDSRMEALERRIEELEGRIAALTESGARLAQEGEG